MFLHAVRRKASMRVIRQSVCFIALILTGALGGCGLSPAAQSAMVHPSSAQIARPTAAVVPRVLPTSTRDAGVNPTRLIIPAIGINTSIEQVGMQSNGDM